MAHSLTYEALGLINAPTLFVQIFFFNKECQKEKQCMKDFFSIGFSYWSVASLTAFYPNLEKYCGIFIARGSFAVRKEETIKIIMFTSSKEK